MLLDGASRALSVVINGRVQKLFKEVVIEEQSGFSGERACSDGGFCTRAALRKQ